MKKHSVRLLLVDDDDGQRIQVEGVARRAGFKDITLAKSAKEARQFIESQAFDVAVIDVVLTPPPSGVEEYPEDGLEIVQLLRKKSPTCRVVALTTKLEKEAGYRAIDAGAHDFVCARASEDIDQWPKFLRVRLDLWRVVAEGQAATTKPFIELPVLAPA